MTRARGVTLAGVPALLAEPASDPPHRAAIWFHGYRADALAHAAELERCAGLGFLAVGIDAVDHGARAASDLAARAAAHPLGALGVMLALVERTVAELPALVDALARMHGADARRVSLVGVSMGAFLAYRAVVTGLPVRAVVALLGSPEWPGDTSAHRHLAAFRDVALLGITAEHDESVPPDAVRRFHDALDVAHGASTKRRHHVLRGSGHLTPAPQWAEAMDATMAWLARYG